jgi:hypothetical protein
MRHVTPRHIMVVSALIIVASIAALWSWNTLAALFGGPEAGIRHVVAAMTLLLISRFLLLPRHGRRPHALRSRRR